MENNWKRVGSHGAYYFENEKGNLSEGYYFAKDYSDGFALVRKEEDGPWCYRDREGKLSEPYCHARDYSDGFALVQKEKYGPYYFRDIEWNLSEGYYFAKSYSDGFALVQKEKYGPYYFRDIEGNLSEGYYDARDYSDGFALVQKEKYGPGCYRDMCGRVTDARTVSGKALYDLYEGKIEAQEIPIEFFEDERFKDKVVEITHDRSKKEVESYIDEDKYKELTESCYYVEKFHDGFVRFIKEKGGPALFMDMCGRVSEEKTASGADLFDFYSGKIEVKEIPISHFEDKRFKDKITGIMADNAGRKLTEIMDSIEIEDKEGACKTVFEAVSEELNDLGQRMKEYSLLNDYKSKIKDVISNI